MKTAVSGLENLSERAGQAPQAAPQFAPHDWRWTLPRSPPLSVHLVQNHFRGLQVRNRGDFPQGWELCTDLGTFWATANEEEVEGGWGGCTPDLMASPCNVAEVIRETEGHSKAPAPKRCVWGPPTRAAPPSTPPGVPARAL